MKTETEVKFLDISIRAVRNQLKVLGAVCEQPMRTMRRTIIDYPDKRLEKEIDAFIRVRDEGDKITLTYKQFKQHSVDGAREIELVVSSYEDIVSIFEAIGLSIKSFQESRRETWRLGSTEIMLDEWPWLKPYMEIEGESEAALRDVAKKLGLNWDNAVFGDVMAAYRAEYPHLHDTDTVGSLSQVQFDAPLPALLKA